MHQEIELSTEYGSHFFGGEGVLLKNSSRVPMWHPACFSYGQLRDAESTKKT